MTNDFNRRELAQILRFKAKGLVKTLLVAFAIVFLASRIGVAQEKLQKEPIPTPIPTQLVQTVSELEASNKALADRLRAQELALLESQRKSIDWWFAALAILTGVVALIGAVLPYLMGRKDRELLQTELQNAKDLVSSIKGQEQVAREITTKLDKFVSGSSDTEEQKEAVAKEAKTVAASPQADAVDKLRARAVLASQKEQPDEHEARTAYNLWFALVQLLPDDVSVQFNAGYWAQELSEMKSKPGRAHWHELACNHYAQALAIKPDKHEAANNWGNALANEAMALKESQDLAGARALWKAAGERYAQALAIKPDKHEAANNWGIALANEAMALKESQDLAGARALWKAAGERYAQALMIKPDIHEAANNWGMALIYEFHALTSLHQRDDANECLIQAVTLLTRHSAMDDAGRKCVAYNLACAQALRGDASAAITQLEISRSAGQLPGHWREDHDFAPIRNAPEYQAWVQTHFPSSPEEAS